MMTLLEAIGERHSIRKYKKIPLSEEVINKLQVAIDECNRDGGLHIQLILNEPKGISRIHSYGLFTHVENYLVMAGAYVEDIEEKLGYYGEKIVLMAQQMGLGTCWVGGSYRKIRGAYELAGDDKMVGLIAIGYPDQVGRTHSVKSVQQVSNADEQSPEWFVNGVRSALMAPTAVNQQKFHFELLPSEGSERPRVRATSGRSIYGHTKLDLGIVKLHFEIGAGMQTFEWV